MNRQITAHPKSYFSHAAATSAVQCVISSADAICVYEKGVRSVSQDHLDVYDLVAGLALDGAQERSRQLRKIIVRDL